MGRDRFADGSLSDVVFAIDRRGGGPIARQIHGQARAAILSRALRPGAKLPSSRALATRLGVARASVVAAYEELATEGWVTRRVGSGTYVSSDLPEPLERRGRAAAIAALPARRIPLSPRARAYASHADAAAAADERPFQMGRSRVDARTLDVWRRLGQRALRELGPRHLGYSDPRGLPELRETICSYLRATRGVRCEPEQILVTTGTQHALDLAIRILLEPGDDVWVEDPGYPMTAAALSAAGVRPRPIPVDEQGLVVRAGMHAAPRARAAFVTPSHQFPLGHVLSMARRLELLAWARERGAWIFEDDYDGEFRYAGRPLASLQGLDDAERVLYVGTLNKVLFPGLRVGYLVLPPPLLRAFVAARHLSDRQPQSWVQVVLAEFLREGHFASHVRRMRLRYREQRDALVGALQRRLGAYVRVDPPEQGMRLVAYLADGASDAALEEAALRAGVVARALSGFYRAAPPRSGLVLGFTGHAPATIAPAVATLASVAGAQLRAARAARRGRRT